jgi:hypothetical protein
MTKGYTNVVVSSDSPWMIADAEFNKKTQIPIVKKLLMGETDLRWARIALDERILAKSKEKDYRYIIGIMWRLGGAAQPPFNAHPLDKLISLIPGDDKGRRELLGTLATLSTVEAAYGKPTRTETVDEVTVHYFGLIGFCTDGKTDKIVGVRMPFVFFKLGHRDFARMILQISEGKKTEADHAPAGTARKLADPQR